MAVVTLKEPESEFPAFISAGFRPFFLFAGFYGTFPLVYWIVAFVGEVSPPGAMDPIAWHGHEMIFGFGAAGMAGFLLTAVPSWTKTVPVKGRPLVLLALLWLLGRVAMWGGWELGPWAVAGADIALLVALAVILGSKIIACGEVRNYPLAGMIVALLAANVLMHLEPLGVLEDSAAIGMRLGVYVFCLLVALIGGRVIPAFTTNVLRMRGGPQDVASHPVLEKLVLPVLLVTIGLDLLDPDDGIWRDAAGAAALLSGVVLTLRMMRWRLVRILDEPILWILHMGHVWLAVGFFLKGLADLSDLVATGDAIHAFSAGAMGTMIMAMMTRASLGHTGRVMKAPPMIVIAYFLVIFGAVLRVAGPWFGDMAITVISTGGMMWVGGFVLFSVIFWPILTRPRI